MDIANAPQGLVDWTGAGYDNDSRAMVLLATRTPLVPRLRRSAGRHCRRSILAGLLGCLVATRAFALALEVETTPAGDIFPTLEMSQAGSEDSAGHVVGNGLLRLRVVNSGPSRNVRVVVATEGLRTATVMDSRVDGIAVLRPRLEWDVGDLRGLVAVRAQTLKVTLTSPGMTPIVRELGIRVHPLDEALYFVREGSARIDLGWTFAAWVDPQHPVIDELLALAGLSVAPGVSGPAGRAERLRTARAIWVALERRGLRYADEVVGISQGPVIYSQRVRLLSSTWEDRVANCMDGSVLIASALERLGIESFLVLVPGHAFVGFYTDDRKLEAELLETTLLGHGKPGPRSMAAESAAQLRRRAEAGFEAARKSGGSRYRLAAARLDGSHRPEYALIDISRARAYGIMPLAIGREGTRAVAPSAATQSLRVPRSSSQSSE